MLRALGRPQLSLSDTVGAHGQKCLRKNAFPRATAAAGQPRRPPHVGARIGMGPVLPRRAPLPCPARLRATPALRAMLRARPRPRVQVGYYVVFVLYLCIRLICADRVR
jgi:hypothetical protein